MGNLADKEIVKKEEKKRRKAEKKRLEECNDTVACTAGFPCPEFFDFLLARGFRPTVRMQSSARDYPSSGSHPPRGSRLANGHNINLFYIQ